MADETATADIYLKFITLSATTKRKGLGDLTFPVLTADGAGFFGDAGVGELELPLFECGGSGFTGAVATFDKSIPGLELSAETLYGDVGVGSILLSLPTSSSQGVTGEVSSDDVILPLLEAAGDDLHQGQGSINLSGLAFAGIGVVGQVGQLSDELPNLTVASRGVRQGDNAADLSFLPLTLEATGFQEGLGQGVCQISLFTLQSEGIAGEAGATDLTFPVFTITSSGGGSYAGTAAIILPAFILEAGGERDLAASLVGGIVDISVYSMNLSNFGVSTFSNYPFNSYCLFKGSYLGAKVDGIYLLSGQQDSAANIEVEMLQSAIGQEASNKKGIPVIYADLETDGQFDLTIQSEDQEQAYPGIPYHSGMRLQKVKVGRGLKGRYFGIGLKNRDGAKMRVNSLEIPVDISSTRKGR